MLLAPEALARALALGLLGRRRSLLKLRPLRLAVRAQLQLPQRPAGAGRSLAGLRTALLQVEEEEEEEEEGQPLWQPGAGAAAAAALQQAAALRCHPEGLALLLLLLLLLLPAAALQPERAGCAGLRAWQSRAMLW